MFKLQHKARPEFNRLRHWLRQVERGEDSSFEFIAMIGPVMFTIILIASAVVYWTTRLPAQRAATACARQAIATLDPVIGVRQGELAGELTLNGSAGRITLGPNGEPEYHVTVTWDTTGGNGKPNPDASPTIPGHAAAWKSFTPVYCTVSYRIDLSDLTLDLFGSVTALSSMLDVNEQVVMSVDPKKSDWAPTQ